MAAGKQATDTVQAEAPQGPELFNALVTAVRQAKVGKVLPHSGGAYVRVQKSGRTIGYVVLRRKGVAVYPNALAGTMPKGLSFQRCELGSHHYGRGEVILTIMSEADFGDAVKALEAAGSAAPIPRKEKVAA